MTLQRPTFVALGANLPHPELGPPVATCRAALDAMEAAGVRIEARSRWFRTAPVPASDQPWFVNGVVRIDAEETPEALLETLHRIEDSFGRARGEPNAARILDLDLLAVGTLVTGPGTRPELPHPRLRERAFVVLPLADVAPGGWHHPVSGATIEEMIAALPRGQVAEPMG